MWLVAVILQQNILMSQLLYKYGYTIMIPVPTIIWFVQESRLCSHICKVAVTLYVVYLAVILVWQVGESNKNHQN